MLAAMTVVAEKLKVKMRERMDVSCMVVVDWQIEWID